MLNFKFKLLDFDFSCGRGICNQRFKAINKGEGSRDLHVEPFELYFVGEEDTYVINSVQEVVF